MYHNYLVFKYLEQIIYLCFITMLKPFTVWITTYCEELLKRDGNNRPPYLPPEKSVYVKKQQLEPEMEQQTGSKWDRSRPRLYIVTLLI